MSRGCKLDSLTDYNAGTTALVLLIKNLRVKEIKEWKSGKHCFGNYLVVEGKDFETLNEDEVISFITEQLKITQNRSYLLQEILKMVLEDMDFEIVEDDSYSCEQCGDWNHHTKYKR